ncbi:LLM class flavin-dependent oxidoreductase [Streptomyces sp. DSM 44915]|uniref:LLM class flavin-dependent oxidoreductase n=1 Tax=Streptomyces chisholmiae TaxID=3075540 RepID=A0ABU2JQY7_9ACTN|nr:LLM class flavin-dependent oxidoreductase [Streptomyces sp. DSM 44915]MDT0266633.1 LLM class flavin-dependent oxidoreductase [Streptomyces sp. DSM 44915]
MTTPQQAPPPSPSPAPPPAERAVTLAELLANAGPAGYAWPALRAAVTAAERRGVTTLLLPGPATGPGPAPVEASTLAAAVLRATRTLRVVVPLDPDRVAPYNAARILGTLAYLGPDRVLLAHPTDTANASVDAARWADYVAAVRALLDSFPRTAIVADRATGRYFDAAGLAPHGYLGTHHRVAGVLNLPRPPGGPLRTWPDDAPRPAPVPAQEAAR